MNRRHLFRTRPARLLRHLLLLCIACPGLGALPAYAEILPIQSYTTANGLARDLVGCIVQDSRGFLWFCTGEGISRFDGYSFTSFGRMDGLPGRAAADLIEARDGTIWVATDDGLTRLDPGARFRGVEGNGSATPLFKTFRPEGSPATRNLRTLLEARDGALYVGTFDGLFRFSPGDERFEPVFLDDPKKQAGKFQINDLLEDSAGNLWIATRYLGLIRRRPDGGLDHYLRAFDPPFGNIRALAFDGKGGIWAGGYDGLRHLLPDDHGGLRVAAWLTASEGLPDRQIYSLYRGPDPHDRLIVGAVFGVAILAKAANEKFRLEAIGPRQGLSLVKTISVSEDHSGNIWVGSDGSGAFKIGRTGFTSFSAKDGLPGPFAVSFLHDRRGALYASTHTMDAQTALNRLDGSPGPTLHVNVPSRLKGRGWGIAQLTFQDPLGDWWVPTAEGVVRFSGVERAEELAKSHPSAVYATREGLASADVFKLFGDSRGNVWISANGLFRYERAANRILKLDDDGGHAMGEDASGGVWIGGWNGDLARYQDGRVDRFTAAAGVPAGAIEAIFLDSRRRLWIGATDGGAARIDDPAAPKPVFRSVRGLASSQVNCFVEDHWGRIYMGTGRGVDVLDPDTGRIRHFTTADGLLGSDVTLAGSDAAGNLWFGTQAGLSRLVPQPPDPRRPPPIWISSLSVAGIRQPINLLGERALAGLELDASQHDVEIGFVGLDYSAGEKLRYRFRLEGAEEGWSEPSERRRVNFANLSAGRYRFLVKAVDSDGQGSSLPATVSFTILPPLWQRGWFISLCGLTAAALAYALHRYRVSHLLRLERVRTHIASDLHDDIGASLSRIAMQSDLVKLPLVSAEQAQRLLSDIGESARSLVDAMSDIVWSIDPKRDDLASLAARVRQFALGMFEPRGIALDLKVPDDARKVQLVPEDRRHLLLLIKEAVNNIARHSGCRHVWITLDTEGSRLRMEVRDDGSGFTQSSAGPAPAGGGHGLRSMTARAEQLRGTLSVDSAPGRGTTLSLRCTLQQTGA